MSSKAMPITMTTKMAPIHINAFLFTSSLFLRGRAGDFLRFALMAINLSSYRGFQIYTHCNRFPGYPQYVRTVSGLLFSFAAEKAKLFDRAYK
jgi:hypothetical protein